MNHQIGGFELKRFGIIVLVLLILMPQFVFSKTYENSEDIKWFNHFAVQFDEEKAFQNIIELTDDQYTGRQSGTPGCYQSAQWIAEQFGKFNLTPFHDESYFQPFDVPFYDVLNPLQFSYETANGWKSFRYREDFFVFPKTTTGLVDSEFVFVGYGLTNKEESYDDYVDVSVKGKVVLIIDRVPDFTWHWDKNRLFDPSYCIDNAIQHGASGIVFIAQEYWGWASFNNLMNRRWVYFQHQSSVPCLYLLEKAAIQFFNASHIDYEKQIRVINDTKKPASIEMNVKTRMEVHVDQEKKKTQNVIGYIPAINPLEVRSIVIGSHYDHLGKDQINGDIYRGANDNASGVAVLIEIARLLQKSLAAPQVNIVFIAFSGEEEGLVGSSYYVSHPLFPIDEIIAMINMDQIGNGNEQWSLSKNVRSNEELLDNAITASADYGLKEYQILTEIWDNADHYPFYKEKVSVFFISKNEKNYVRNQYHTKEDTSNIIDPENLLECGQTVVILIFLLGDFLSISLPELKRESVFFHPKIILEAESRGFKNTNKKLFIESYQIDLTSSQSFQISVPLKNGETTFRFIIFGTDIYGYDNKKLKELNVVLATTIDPSLATDFDFNRKTDFYDFIAFSKVFNSSAPLYSPLSIYDLNNDERIDHKDFEIFSK
jgi:hypothetical protein